MSDRTRPADFSVVRHPLHAALAAVPVVCFTGALLTDIAYAASPDMQWANFSAWLLFFGVAFAVLAAVAGVVDFAGRRRSRAQAPAWPHAIGNGVVLVLALFNNFVHSRDAWTSVVPTGLTLSALTVLAMLATVLLGRSIRDRTPTGDVR